MDPSLKFFLGLIMVVVGISLFLPVVTNPNPIDCNNYPDGTGGYYSKCKDENISLIQKWKLPKDTVPTNTRTF